MTGGGAYKFKDEIEVDISLNKKKTGLVVVQIEEMESIYSGINFGKALHQKIFYTLDKNNQRVYSDSILQYPFITVNIGSGVSIILFSRPHGDFKRVGGTSLGGRTK